MIRLRINRKLSTCNIFVIFSLVFYSSFFTLPTHAFQIHSQQHKIYKSLRLAANKPPQYMKLSKSELCLKKEDVLDTDGTERGKIIFVMSLLLCIWSFTIPVELRRSHFCFSDRCAANRVACDNCVTFKEWGNDVKNYYKNGGGVHFDFSIEEKN